MKNKLALTLAGTALIISTASLVPAQDAQSAPGTAFGPDALHAQSNLDLLSALSGKTSLTKDELDQARKAMLTINNEARANPEYRKKQKCTTFLTLPSDLPPFVLDDACNNAAQEQAEYQAGKQQLTHDNSNYSDSGKRLAKHGASGPEACAIASSLEQFPIGWMSSETHHRPTWNLGAKEGDAPYPVRKVGYGVAKGRDGYWYFTAIWRPVDDADKAAIAAAVPGGKPAATDEKLPLSAGSELKVGAKYPSPSGGHYLTFQPDGNLVVYTSAGQHVWDIDSAAPKRKDAKAARMEADGNLVVRDAAGNHVWSALHKDPDPTATLTISPTGRLRLVSGKSRQVLWSSVGADPIPVVTSGPPDYSRESIVLIGGAVNWAGYENQICDQVGIVYAPTSANADPLMGGKDVVIDKLNRDAVDGTKGNSTGAWGIPLVVDGQKITIDTEYTFKAYAVFGKETFYSPAQTFKTDK